MGEVYRAKDTRLDRVVAIKILPEHLSSRPQLRERFEREARAIAALNHPNICNLYDVGPNYLVMEYVEGSPVSAPGNVRKLLDIAAQIADGLAAAHAARVIHRDLKPDILVVLERCTRKGKRRETPIGNTLRAIGVDSQTPLVEEHTRRWSLVSLLRHAQTLHKR